MMARLFRNPFSASLVLFLGLAMAGLQPAVAQDEPENEPLPLEELRTFVEILNRVKQGYVENVSDEKLLENAIRGMLDGLDPHSSYLAPEEFKEIQISTSGKFGGLGIEVQMQNGFVKVVTPIDDTPAKKAGILAGDLIVRIDDASVKGLTLMDAVKKMRGDPGTSITLTILREGRDGPFKVTVERDIISVRSVRARMLDPGYGYIRISQFSSQTGSNLESELKQLMTDAGGQLNGLVLDLRNNPGGVLNAAVEVSDAFLNSGNVVSIKGREADSEQTFDAHEGDMLNGRPIVVLVNQGSASASEIVAGALQDHGRAVVMGYKTFGKGSVQTILPLRNDAALKLTTARYYTPNGRSIQAEGIAPDVEIQSVKVTAQESENLLPFSEADLVGSLANEDSEAAEDGTGKQAKEAKPNLAERDYPLYEALNLLKGLYILGDPKQKPTAKSAEKAGPDSP